jgi:hypothetical protein
VIPVRARRTELRLSVGECARLRGSQKVRTLAALAAALLALFAAFVAPPPASADEQQFILDAAVYPR